MICGICTTFHRHHYGALCDWCWNYLATLEHPMLDVGIQVHSLFSYQEPMDRVVKNLKGGSPLFRILAEQLSLLMSEMVAQEHPIGAIVPVPSHEHGKKDHAWTLAYHVSQALGRPLWDDLLTMKNRSRQTGKSGSDRAQIEINLSDLNAFSQRYHGGRIILVDDVVTTGSTLKAAALALKPAPCLALTLAQTPYIKVGI